jgi:hypothetical protein
MSGRGPRRTDTSNTLCIEDQLLMMLEYWREYQTYFHIGQAYGLSESAAYRNIKWCENTLAKSKAFRLPGRKAIAASERVFDVVLIDATYGTDELPPKFQSIMSPKVVACGVSRPHQCSLCIWLVFNDLDLFQGPKWCSIRCYIEGT